MLNLSQTILLFFLKKTEISPLPRHSCHLKTWKPLLSFLIISQFHGQHGRVLVMDQWVFGGWPWLNPFGSVMNFSSNELGIRVRIKLWIQMHCLINTFHSLPNLRVFLMLSIFMDIKGVGADHSCQKDKFCLKMTLNRGPNTIFRCYWSEPPLFPSLRRLVHDFRDTCFWSITWKYMCDIFQQLLLSSDDEGYKGRGTNGHQEIN